MTNPRAWPNNAANDRDTAAEQFNAIIRRARGLQRRIHKGEINRIAIMLDLSYVIDDAQTGVRCLERHGANTLPVARED